MDIRDIVNIDRLNTIDKTQEVIDKFDEYLANEYAYSPGKTDLIHNYAFNTISALKANVLEIIQRSE